MRKATISLGRMNPITRGHYRMIREVINIAKQNNSTPMVFIIDGLKSGMDKSKNPLTGEERKSIIKKLFPDLYVDIINSAYDVFDVLYIQGYEIDVLVAGSDRADNYEKMLNTYSTFGKIFSLDRNIKEYDGVSGTAARLAVSNNDFTSFKNIMPSDFDQLMLEYIFERISEGLNHEQFKQNYRGTSTN